MRVLLGLIIYVDEENITPWFNAAADDDEINRDKVSVSRKTATSVDVSFSSGTFDSRCCCSADGHTRVVKQESFL